MSCSSQRETTTTLFLAFLATVKLYNLVIWPPNTITSVILITIKLFRIILDNHDFPNRFAKPFNLQLPLSKLTNNLSAFHKLTPLVNNLEFGILQNNVKQISAILITYEPQMNKIFYISFQPRNFSLKPSLVNSSAFPFVFFFISCCP